MNDKTVTELFPEKGSPESDPNWNYTVTFKDGRTEQAVGYLVLGQNFIAVAQGQGVLQHVWPLDTYQSITNDGLVVTGAALN